MNARNKVRLRLFDNIMADHLNLMLHEGRWMIYAKHFYWVGSWCAANEQAARQNWAVCEGWCQGLAKQANSFSD